MLRGLGFDVHGSDFRSACEVDCLHYSPHRLVRHIISSHTWDYILQCIRDKHPLLLGPVHVVGPAAEDVAYVHNKGAER